MKTIPKRSLRIAAVALAGVLGLLAAGNAQTPAKEGRYDYTACWSGQSTMIAFSKTHTAFSYEMMGSTEARCPTASSTRTRSGTSA